jgi:hypothetical protein
MGRASWHLPFLGHCGAKFFPGNAGSGTKACSQSWRPLPISGNARQVWLSSPIWNWAWSWCLRLRRHLIARPRRLQCSIGEDQNHRLLLAQRQKVEKVDTSPQDGCCRAPESCCRVTEENKTIFSGNAGSVQSEENRRQHAQSWRPLPISRMPHTVMIQLSDSNRVWNWALSW